MKKRVLFISYDFIPCAAPGAAIRSSKFVRYLPEFGWDATVVARREPGWGSAGETANVVRISSPRVPFSYQLTAWLWAAKAWFHLSRVVEAEKFHVLYVSCPPFPLGLIASMFARKWSLPLVVDFRDAWSMDPYRPKSRMKAAIKGLFCRRIWPPLEHRVLTAADLLLVPTNSMRCAYRRLIPDRSKGPVLLANGFDERDFQDYEITRTTLQRERRHLTLEILYCGRFTAVGNREPAWLFRSLRRLNNEGKPVRLKILGDDSAGIKRLIRRTGSEGLVVPLGTVDHGAVPEVMMNCDALLVYQEESENELWSVAGKTYEYLRSGKPILIVAPEGDNVELVEKYGKVHFRCTDFSEDTLLKALRALFDAWENGALPGSSMPDSEYMNRYNRRALTGRLAALFDGLVQRRGLTGATSPSTG